MEALCTRITWDSPAPSLHEPRLPMLWYTAIVTAIVTVTQLTSASGRYICHSTLRQCRRFEPMFQPTHTQSCRCKLPYLVVQNLSSLGHTILRILQRITSTNCKEINTNSYTLHNKQEENRELENSYFHLLHGNSGCYDIENFRRFVNTVAGNLDIKWYHCIRSGPSSVVQNIAGKEAWAVHRYV